MPFKNSRQRKACYAQKRKNPNSTWDCKKWDRHTKSKLRTKRPKKK